MTALQRYENNAGSRRCLGRGAGMNGPGGSGTCMCAEMRIFARAFHLFHKINCMSWIVLVVAGFLETGFTFCLGKMKVVSGIEWYLWGVGFLVCLALSMALLLKAVQSLPIGTAYLVWTGIGAVGTVVLGIVFFHEPASFSRLFFIATLMASIVGLKMVSH